MMNERVALIGVSHWHAAMHAEAARAARADNVAAWDPAEDIAKAFGEEFGCATTAGMDEAIALADLAVVMGRPSEIAARGLAVIQAGVPALLEKPIGVSAADTDKLIAAAEGSNCFAAVALPHGPGMMAAMRDLEQADRLGRISHSHFRLINGPPQRYVRDRVGWVLDRSIGGGGALRNLGIHGINAFLGLSDGQEVDMVSVSFGRPVHGTEVEDYAVAVLRAADGTLGIVEAGYVFASMEDGMFEWRVLAANATLSDLGDRISIATLDDGQTSELAATPLARRYGDVMADTLARLAEGRPPAVSLADSRRAMAIIDRCYATREA